MKEKKFFPDYEKMELLVGKNSIVFDLIKFFYSKEQYYNIYDDKIEKIENLESFESFVKAVIEYYKYKNYYLYEPDEEEKDVHLKKIKSTPQLDLRKLLSGISNNDNTWYFSEYIIHLFAIKGRGIAIEISFFIIE